MEVEYLREMRQNYLMIQVDEKQRQGYEARMMTGNTIEGLLKFRIKKTENRCTFCYEITSKQPLGRILEKRAINAEQIRRLLFGIARTLTRMEDYLLTEEQILLNPDYIYIDPEEYQPFLCLLPGKKGNFPEEFSLFLQFLLGKVDHKEKEAVVLIYGLYRESLKENYGLDNLLRWLMKEDYPDMEYRNNAEKCEKIKKENTESWEKEEEPEEAEKDLPKAKRREKVHGSSKEYQFSPARESVVSEEKSRYIYFLPGSAVVLLSIGIRFFSGRYRFVRYGIYLAVVGIALLAIGMSLFLLKVFLGKKGDQASSSCLIPHNSPSCSQLSCEKASKHTLSNTQLFHEETSIKETSTETSGYTPLISNQNSHLKASVQPGQWQMIFEEPDEENEAEASLPVDSHEDEMHTVLLWNQSEEKEVRSLVSQNGEETILLSYYPFIIGKQEGLCDYVLDKSTVSRLHVRIDETENGYMVTDLNSTNGTFVNGNPLDANGTAPIEPGDEIGVADLRFQMK